MRTTPERRIHGEGFEPEIDEEGEDRRTDPHRPGRLEWAAALAIVVIGAVLVAVWSDGAWFYSDVWDFLALRRITDLESMMRPHFGHWQVPVALQTRLLYGIGGMDYWPTYQVARATWWGLASLFVWWMMRRRGTDGRVALVALAVLSSLGTGFYFQAAHLGALVATSSVVGAARLIETRQRPTALELLWMYGLMQLAVMSAGVGVASLAGVGLAVLILRRFRWVLPIAGAGAVYAAWFVVFDIFGVDEAGAVRRAASIPLAFAENVRSILLHVTGLPQVLGWPLFVVAVAGLGWAIWKRRITPFGVVVLVCVAVYLTLIARSRMNVMRPSVATNVVFLVVAAFTPFVSMRRRWAPVALAIVAGALLVSHGVRLEAGLDERVAAAQEGRPVIEAMATLIADGEPYYGPLLFTDISSSSQLTVKGLARLVAEGWDPQNLEAVDVAAVRLRVSQQSTPAERPGSIEVIDGRLRADGCVIAFDADPLALEVTGPTDLTIRSRPPGAVLVTWSGPGTPGAATFRRIAYNDEPIHAYGPGSGATVTFTTGDASGRIIVCGVAGLAPEGG